jgi:YVTN family beta-propeller protein
VSVIDTATNKITANIPTGFIPWQIAVTPDGSKLYATSAGSADVAANPFPFAVSVIDTATNAVTTTIRIGSEPFGVAVTPDGRRVYVTSLTIDTSSVLVIDTTTNTVIATIPVSGGAGGVSVTPDWQEGVCRRRQQRVGH